MMKDVNRIFNTEISSANVYDSKTLSLYIICFLLLLLMQNTGCCALLMQVKNYQGSSNDRLKKYDTTIKDQGRVFLLPYLRKM